MSPEKFAELKTELDQWVQAQPHNKFLHPDDFIEAVIRSSGGPSQRETTLRTVTSLMREHPSLKQAFVGNRTPTFERRVPTLIPAEPAEQSA